MFATRDKGMEGAHICPPPPTSVPDRYRSFFRRIIKTSTTHTVLTGNAICQRNDPSDLHNTY